MAPHHCREPMAERLNLEGLEWNLNYTLYIYIYYMIYLIYIYILQLQLNIYSGILLTFCLQAFCFGVDSCAGQSVGGSRRIGCKVPSMFVDAHRSH